MFQYKNIVYADPGKYLIGNHKVGYQFPGELSEFEEKGVDMKVTNCEDCNNFVYDEESETYYCEMELDEDEYMKFVSASFYNCPYYDPYDEYKIVRKQNWI